MKLRLSERLNILLSFCKKGSPLWDLACDHGYLGLMALEKQLCPHVTFCDLSKVAMEALKCQPLLMNKYQGFHEIVTGDFCDLQIPDRDCNIVLAGLGFHKIKKFVAKNSELKNIRYIIHPAKHPELMTPYMQGFGFTEISHKTCKERWEEHIFVYEKV